MMTDLATSLSLATPELIVAVGAIALLMFGVFSGPRSTSTINGLAVAFTTGVIVYFWASSFGIALVIAISMVLSMMIAGFSGAGIPMALKAAGQDSATSSSIILTTVTDICGFLSFLGLATALASALGIT